MDEWMDGGKKDRKKKEQLDGKESWMDGSHRKRK